MKCWANQPQWFRRASNPIDYTLARMNESATYANFPKECQPPPDWETTQTRVQWNWAKPLWRGRAAISTWSWTNRTPIARRNVGLPWNAKTSLLKLEKWNIIIAMHAPAPWPAPNTHRRLDPCPQTAAESTRRGTGTPTAGNWAWWCSSCTHLINV